MSEPILVRIYRGTEFTHNELQPLWERSGPYMEWQAFLNKLMDLEGIRGMVMVQEMMMEGVAIGIRVTEVMPRSVEFRESEEDRAHLRTSNWAEGSKGGWPNRQQQSPEYIAIMQAMQERFADFE